MGAQASTLVANAFPTDIWIKVDAEKVMVSCPFFIERYPHIFLILRRGALRKQAMLRLVLNSRSLLLMLEPT